MCISSLYFKTAVISVRFHFGFFLPFSVIIRDKFTVKNPCLEADLTSLTHGRPVNAELRIRKVPVSIRGSDVWDVAVCHIIFSTLRWQHRLWKWFTFLPWFSYVATITP
uniref:Uncharacterized protein n=1 Tax=Schistocephalus solidus TaxID=70667 RepID=A0A0X3NY66_SCHSO